MLVFDHSVDIPPFPSTSPFPSHPSPHPFLLPCSSPVDHADADREQRAAGGPAGWGVSWSWGGGARWRRRRLLARGWDARRSWRRGSGWIQDRSRSPRALCALLGHPPLPSPPEGPAGLLHVRARCVPRPHGPWSPSPGLPGSPPAAHQLTQRKLELSRPLSTSCVPFGGPDWWIIVQSLPLYFPPNHSPSASRLPIFLFERSSYAWSPFRCGIVATVCSKWLD